MSGEPSPNLLTVVAAITATLTGLGGILLGTKGRRTDDMTAVVATAMSLVEPLRAEVAELRAELAECNARHEKAEQALRAAGLL